MGLVRDFISRFTVRYGNHHGVTTHVGSAINEMKREIS